MTQVEVNGLGLVSNDVVIMEDRHQELLKKGRWKGKKAGQLFNLLL